MILSTRPLLRWYNQSKRELPWRRTTDPYLIWISEVVLQQTRIEQGLSYYERFTTRFPTVETLAAATTDEVLLQWQGLGYYSRARNLHKAARMVMSHFGGKMPETASGLATLSGTGDYTAAAVASIAYGEPVPAVDGNVMRVLGRYQCLPHKVNSAAMKNACREAIENLMKEACPGDINQAFMELGALVCKPVGPSCQACPLMDGCQAFRAGLVNNFPVKAAKSTPKNRYFTYLVLVRRHNNQSYLIIRQRHQPDIWSGLFELPLIETDTEPTLGSITRSDVWNTFIKNRVPDLQTAHYRRHQLTHQTLHCWFIREENEVPVPDGCLEIGLSEIHKYAFPRLIRKYLDDAFPL